MRTKPVTIVVSDRMQSGYTYVLTEPEGKNFHPDFTPHLSPKEMLSLGIFCGKYMRDCRNEFPASWFNHAKEAKTDTPDCSLNYFGVKASQPLSEWRRKGWIYAEDPRGWFQWYCRYYRGRRLPNEDARQIRRWRAFARHAYQVAAHCRKGDGTCRKVQRQALLHWAYDSRTL